MAQRLQPRAQPFHALDRDDAAEGLCSQVDIGPGLRRFT